MRFIASEPPTRQLSPSHGKQNPEITNNKMLQMLKSKNAMNRGAVLFLLVCFFFQSVVASAELAEPKADAVELYGRHCVHFDVDHNCQDAGAKTPLIDPLIDKSDNHGAGHCKHCDHCHGSHLTAISQSPSIQAVEESPIAYAYHAIRIQQHPANIDRPPIV